MRPLTTVPGPEEVVKNTTSLSPHTLEDGLDLKEPESWSTSICNGVSGAGMSKDRDAIRVEGLLRMVIS